MYRMKSNRKERWAAVCCEANLGHPDRHAKPTHPHFPPWFLRALRATVVQFPENLGPRDPLFGLEGPPLGPRDPSSGDFDRPVGPGNRSSGLFVPKRASVRPERR